MANLLWGKVYFKDIYVGQLEEKPGERYIFTYDASYLEQKQPAIAHTLPLTHEPYISDHGLHPFFDNLVAEGWAKNAQARTLGVDSGNRFALLLGFGHDLIGAISIVDSKPQKHHELDHADEATLAVLSGRASISGIQRKLLVVQEGQTFRPVGPRELSTHIAKLASGNLNELLELEYLSTQAMRALLPHDDIVEMKLAKIPAIKENALVIPRFDRNLTGKRLYHFEEFNQLMGRLSDDKYDGSYEELGQFILNTPQCIPAEADRLFRRILACFVIGNTDAHFKNFAMFHTRDGLRLTPAYDLLASSIYPEYQTVALHVAGIRNLSLGKLEPKHIIKMSESFGVDDETLISAVDSLQKYLPQALEAVEKPGVGSSKLQKQLQEKMEKRWNGSFKLIGQHLSRKQSKGEKNKN